MIDFAQNIINSNKKIDFKNFNKISDKLTALSIEEALKLIKKNLNSLGINHDNFISEKKLVENQEVEKVIDFFKKINLFIKEKLKLQQVKIMKNG